VVAGLAVSYSHADGDFRRSSGGFDTDSYGPLVYAGFVPARHAFVDVFAGYSRKDYVVEREISAGGQTGNGFVERKGFADGETSGDQYTVGLNAGYDFILRNLTVGPRVGMNYRWTTIDGFAERGRRARACLDGICLGRQTTGLELAYDRQEETSLTSTVGMFASLAISTGFGVLIPQGTFEYVHEFEDNQRTIRFRVVDDLQRHKFSFNNDPPDRDHFYTSVGLALVLPGGFSPFINYRTLLGYSDYSKHTVTAGLRYSF
jgi:outer membrane autotransporter protein